MEKVYEAVKLYNSNATLKEIASKTGLDKRMLERLLLPKKCDRFSMFWNNIEQNTKI